jgi:hypothetical protein
LLFADNTDKDIACGSKLEGDSKFWHASCSQQSGTINDDDMICFFSDSIFSSCSDWDTKNVDDSGLGSDFKIFNNVLYDEEFAMDQPTTCPNIYKGALHGIINPLFEDQNDLLDEGCVDLNCDSLSLCCKGSSYSSSDCDSDYDLNSLVGEVHDRPDVDNQPAFHEKKFGDYSSIFTSASFGWEYSSKQNDGMQGLVCLIDYQFVPKPMDWYFYSE